MDVQLYDAQTIDLLPWPANEDGSYAERFLVPLVKEGISHYVENIQGEIFALALDSFVFPLIVPKENVSNSWVCSPYQHYITYGKANVDLIKDRLFSKVVKQGIALMGTLAKGGHLDSVVYVNHWLTSTDLYPYGLTSDHLKSIVAFLTEHFPGRAIIFRSLTPLTNGSLLESCKKLGFSLIPSRPVFITDGNKQEIFTTRIFKSDLKLKQKSLYEELDETNLSTQDCEALLKLQNLLYVVQQDCSLTPQFNLRYVQLQFEKQLLHFKVLKQEGAIKGVAGFFQRDGTLHCPFFGYDKKGADSSQIYRLLNTSLLLEAQRRKVKFHESAGASFYKSIRRAEPCLEYMAVYTHHLKRPRRAVWSLLSALINWLGPRYMGNY